MDFQSFVNCVAMPCCIMSVEQNPDGGCKMIRIICANDPYKTIMGPAYYDNMPYYELVPQDNKFEDFVYRCAVMGKRMHAYVETKALGCWTDQTMIPLSCNKDGLRYCQYIFEFTQGADAGRMASVSADTSAAVIKACINLMSGNDFQDSVGTVLEDVLTYADAKGCCIMLVDHEKKEAVVFCEKNVPGAWENRSAEEVIDYDLIKTWEKVIGVSNALIIQGEQDFAWLEHENPEWALSMQSNDVQSLVLIPLRRNQAVVGYLYVVNYDVQRIVQVKEMIELLSYVLGSEIFNHLLLKRLDEMSCTDALTGLGNRNAMSQRIRMFGDHAGLKTSVGILNLDLNGLKRVNDEEGHAAGDKMLIHAGELLLHRFDRGDIFRTGGDEFIVIVCGIGRDEFEHRTEGLRNDMNAHKSVCFAMGACWTDGNEDFQTVFQTADRMMYLDKKAFYRKHPELRRR